MKSALVTGANKGIGFEVAKILAQQGYFVYLGSRNPDSGAAAVQQLNSIGLTNIKAIQLDVTDPASAQSGASSIPSLDILVNNAGISGPYQQSALTTTSDDFKTVFETNLFGVINTTQAFIHLLKRSVAPRIVNVSTAMASLTLAYDFAGARYVAYQASKTALNMYTLQLAHELRDTPFKVNAVCPGYTRTDFTNHQGTSSIEEAGQRIAKFALLDQDGPTGQFFSEEYFPAPANCPW
jgi:NAD(P)-dependent dehydrogenase (short-subunit alcohol dehydrogenase family)